jgi:hypothetical protein
MEEKQSNFEGWAVIELFGHSREVGFVSTEHFGPGVLFRVEVPALPEREVTLMHPQWINDQLCDAGTKIIKGVIEGRTRFIGPGAIYAMNPCSKDAAFAAIESMAPRETKIVELVKRKELAPPDEEDYEDDEYLDSESTHVPE